MQNFGIKIDLLKVKGAFVRNLKGKTATKRCLIIPVDEADGMFLGEKGCYLNMTAIEIQNPQFNDTHGIKVEIDKAKREQMSEEDLKAIPFIGNLRPLKEKPQPTMNVTGEVDAAMFAENTDDLPF